MPLLFQHRVRLEDRPVSETALRSYLDHALAATGVKDAGGRPLRYTFHDFRRLFITDAILHGMPPHIAQLVAGHRDINTTMGYKAVYPEEVINGHRAFIARRRSCARHRNTASPPTRNGQSSPATSNAARSHSATAAAPTTPPASTSTHACAARCCAPTPPSVPAWSRSAATSPTASPKPRQARWHGEAEGLKVSLAGASHKLAQMDQITARRSASINLGMPDFAGAAGRAITTPATLTRTQTGTS